MNKENFKGFEKGFLKYFEKYIVILKTILKKYKEKDYKFGFQDNKDTEDNIRFCSGMALFSNILGNCLEEKSKRKYFKIVDEYFDYLIKDVEEYYKSASPSKKTKFFEDLPEKSAALLSLNGIVYSKVKINLNHDSKKINKLLTLVDKILDLLKKDNNLCEKYKIEVFKTFILKMELLNVLKRYEETIIFSKEALKYRLEGNEYEISESKKEYFDTGHSYAEEYSNPLVSYNFLLGNAYLKLDFPNEAYTYFLNAYDYSVDYPSKLYSFKGLINSINANKEKRNLNKEFEIMNYCLEIINLYDSVEFPNHFLEDVSFAYHHFIFSAIFSNKIIDASIYFKKYESFYKDNKKNFTSIDKKINEIHLKSLADFLSYAKKFRQKYNNMDSWEVIHQGLDLEDFEKINGIHPWYIFEKIENQDEELLTKREENITNKILVELETFSNKKEYGNLNDELKSFLEAYKTGLDKSALKHVRIILEEIINSLLIFENISLEIKNNFLKEKPKITYKRKKKIPILNTWGEIQLLHYYYEKNKNKLYRLNAKEFLIRLQLLIDKFNVEMHSEKENKKYPINIYETLYDLHYLIFWFKKHVE